MKRISLIGILLASLTAMACMKTTYVPTAPGNVGSTGGSSNTGGSGANSGGSGSSALISAFSGAWASPTIAGLPLGNCSDVKWLITAQTDTSLSGTVTANCSSGVSVSANLTGTLVSADKIDLVANGTMTAMGVPCAFNIAGTGTRQTDDSMKVDYNGSYCFGTVSGSETLRKFPNA